MRTPHRLGAACAALAALAATACGSSSHSSTPTPVPAHSAAGTSSAAGSSSSSGAPSALSADSRSAATGDIPDNQVFLVFQSRTAGFSMKYPEGWTQLGFRSGVTFKDKNNLVQVTVLHGPTPTPGSVSAQLRTLRRSSPTLSFSAPHSVTVGSSIAVKAVYRTESTPNPVTGKRVQLLVDRYELARAGRLAIVDLGTPKGVDNVDAYRKMIESFRWR